MNKNPNAIQNILIVGGGTSGWMTAAFLNKTLNRVQKYCNITLIEADDIPTVGVGEATIPAFQNFFKVLDIAEEEWMEACNATYKLALNFEGWLTGEANDQFWHPFGFVAPNQGGSISATQHWLHRRKKGDPTSFAKATQEAVQVCDAKKCPKIPFEKGSNNLAYAYHLDAGLFAEFLKKRSVAEGVKRLVGRVEEVNLDERGFIQSVDSNAHGRIEADLFIDCSGFNALLIEKALKEPWESYKDSLLVDRAVAIGTPYASDDPYNKRNGGLNPYTTAKAQKSGWTWNTPLVTKGGNGYVYSSAFATESEAEATFRQFLGAKADNATARHIKMRVGKFKRSWVKNCVSIGLSSGFIEPLESTGIALTQVGIQNLVYNFPDKNFDEALINNYNLRLTSQYENIRDFITLHYCLTQREDTPFWRAVKNESVIPDKLQAQLEEWKQLWPNGRKIGGLMFGDYNYISILAGMKHLPKTILPVLEFYGEDIPFFTSVKEKGESLAERLPTQEAYFKGINKIKTFQLDDSW